MKTRIWDIANKKYLYNEGYFLSCEEDIGLVALKIGMGQLDDFDHVIEFSTGLFDKDNKEIFEGDILFGETRNDPKIPTFTGIVEFHQPTASFLIRSEDGFTRVVNSLYNPVIVGNIYESNPIEAGARVMVMGGDPKIRGEVGVVSCFKEWDLDYCYVKIEDKTYEIHYKDLMKVS